MIKLINKFYHMYSIFLAKLTAYHLSTVLFNHFLTKVSFLLIWRFPPPYPPIKTYISMDIRVQSPSPRLLKENFMYLLGKKLQ